MISLRGVARYGTEARAQNGVIGLGSYTAIVGPNDSGKTGWLEAIARALGDKWTDQWSEGDGFGAFIQLGQLSELTQVHRWPSTSTRYDDAQEFAPKDMSELPNSVRFALECIAAPDAFENARVVEPRPDEWFEFLGAIVDPAARRLLDAALDELCVYRHAHWDGVISWLCVDRGDPEIDGVLERWEKERFLPVPTTFETRLYDHGAIDPELPVPFIPLPLGGHGTPPEAPSAQRLSGVLDDVQDAVARLIRSRDSLDEAAEAMNANLPPLLRDLYEIGFRARRHDLPDLLLYPVGAGRHRAFRLPDLAGGWRLWIALAAYLARRTRGTRDTAPEYLSRLRASPAADVLLIDEPEQNLHASAARSLSRWLAELSGPDLQVVVATHSPVFASPKGTQPRIIQLLPRSERSEVQPGYSIRLPSDVLLGQTRMTARTSWPR